MEVAYGRWTDDVLFGRNRDLPGTPVVNGIQLLGGSFRRGSPTRVRTPPQLASFFIGWRGIQCAGFSTPLTQADPAAIPV